MDRVNKSLWAKIKTWFLAKWKWVIGIFVGVLTISIAFLRRDAFHRENFKNSKENLEKEKKIISDAADALVEGTEKIKEEASIDQAEIEKEHDRSEEKLKDKKEKFLVESKESDTLASDLAKEIGADFVDSE